MILLIRELGYPLIVYANISIFFVSAKNFAKKIKKNANKLF